MIKAYVEGFAGAWLITSGIGIITMGAVAGGIFTIIVGVALLAVAWPR